MELDPDIGPPDPSASVEPIDPGSAALEATVLGNTDITATLGLDSGGAANAQVTDITARFVPLDGSASAPVGVALDGRTVRVRLADRTVNGQLQIAVGWTTSCGTGSGGGSIGLAVVESSVASGCPSTGDDLLASVFADQHWRISLDTVELPIGITGWNGRWIQTSGVDDFPQFAGWDPSIGLAGAPGVNIVLRESVVDLALQSVRAAIFLRAEVVAYTGGSLDEILPLDVVRVNAGPKGRAGIVMPLDLGTYVVELQGSWLTSCLELQTYGVVSVEVR